MKELDDIYRAPMEKVGDFRFDNHTARVFDDMAVRSIPFYEEIQRMVVGLSAHFAQDGSSIYDLGCATGKTLGLFMERLRAREIMVVGIDSSAHMLSQAERKLRDAFPDLFEKRCLLIERDLNAPLSDIASASVIVMNWTLQFVKPSSRESLLQTLYKGLLDGGCLILCEKIVLSNPLLNGLFTDLYHHFKRSQNYSELEIDQKRKALEKVLVPLSVDDNLELLRQAGFKTVEVFFRWYNWAGFIAIK